MALKVPMLDVVRVIGEVGSVVPSYLMLMVDVPPNPAPMTVKVVPPTPVPGLRVIEGVSVKVACAECAGPVAVTV